MPSAFRSTILLLPLLTGPLAAQSAQDAGGFVMHNGADTIVIERFSRSGDSLIGSVNVKGQPRAEYIAVFGSSHDIASLEINVYALGASVDAKPLQHVLVTMRGDSAIADIAGRIQRFGTKLDAIPLMNNSFALAEPFTQRARKAGHAIEIPGWALSGGVTLNLALQPLGADSMVLTIAGQVERLQVDAAGRILGGLLPAQHITVSRVDPATAARLKLGLPDFSAPAGAPYTATEVSLAGQGGIVLGGTLTMPKSPTGLVPAVVMITGSGQQDRDEYIPVAGGYRPFRQIADTLGRRGIAVLRLDDRMVGASGGKIGTSADYADDIRSAIAFLRARPGIDPARIGVIGHSEGGMIAPMVAASDPRLRAEVLLAGPGENGLDIIHYQQRQAIDQDTSIAPAKRAAEYRVAAHTLDSLAANSPWLRFFLTYDPLATARKVKTPTLILQGGNDHQVTPDQAPMLEKAMKAGGNRDVTLHVFPGLNHLFIPDPSGLPTGYAQLTSNRVAPEVLGMIADWLSREFGLQ